MDSGSTSVGGRSVQSRAEEAPLAGDVGAGRDRSGAQHWHHLAEVSAFILDAVPRKVPPISFQSTEKDQI